MPFRRHVVVEAFIAFEGAPSEAEAFAGIDTVGRRGDVDLLERVLTDIGDPEVTGGAIEGESPRVAQPARPDPSVGTVLADEGIVGGDRVRLAG